MENTLNSSSKNVWIIFLLICQTQADANDYSLPNLAKLHFTSGSTMGLYLAVVLPVDLPPTNAYEGFFFEAIYSLPTNETSFDYPPLVERGIDRNFIYDLVEKNIELRGFSGKSCLLRSICEVSMHSIDGASGVIGNILHIILTPSSSKNFGLPPEYEEAENMGQTAHHCTTYHKNCSISIVDLITSLADYE